MKRILWLAFTVTFTLSVLLTGCSGTSSGTGGGDAGQTTNVQETVDNGDKSDANSSEGKSIWDD